MNEHVTVTDVLQARQPLVMITAYDQLSARIVDAAEADMILVGDSLGMVIQGHTNTLQVTLDEVIYHAKAVTRTKPKAMVIGDLPYLSYHVSRAETVRNAGRLVQEAGVDAVKLEGGRNRLTMVSSLIDAEIPVMGHLGLTPQSVNAFGGFKVQGKTKEAGKVIMEDALRLQDAGIFALVLECVPSELAQEITQSLDIPTIGIGAGPYCAGQVLVFHDLLGMSFGHQPKFVKAYADLGSQAVQALQQFRHEVQTGVFPTLAHSYAAKKPRIKAVE